MVSVETLWMSPTRDGLVAHIEPGLEILFGPPHESPMSRTWSSRKQPLLAPRVAVPPFPESIRAASGRGRLEGAASVMGSMEPCE